MPKRSLAVLTLTTFAIFIACGSDKDTNTTPVSHAVTLKATLLPSGEPPGLQGNPTGSGTFTATLDTVTGAFAYTVQFSGLTTTINNGHIHGPFTPGGTATTANVILNFNPAINPAINPTATFTGLNTGTSGTATGSVALVAATQVTTTINGDSLKKLLLAGLTYANIHTTTNAGGEIRGQITRN